MRGAWLRIVVVRAHRFVRSDAHAHAGRLWSRNQICSQMRQSRRRLQRVVAIILLPDFFEGLVSAVGLDS